jgi:hypothetical protein
MSQRHIHRVIALSLVLACGAFGSPAHAEPSNKWRILFDHSTDAAGEITFRIAPVNGTPIDVTTQIPKGKTENQVAQLVKKSLKAGLGKGYKVEVDDFEDVLVKRTGKTPDFELSMLNSSLTGVTVNLKRE